MTTAQRPQEPQIFDGVILSPSELAADLQTIDAQAQTGDFALQCTFDNVVIDADGYYKGRFLLFPDTGLVKTSVQVGAVQFRALVDVTTPNGQLWLKSVFKQKRFCWLLDDAASGDAMLMSVAVKHTPQVRLAYSAAAVRYAPAAPLKGEACTKEVSEAASPQAERSYVPGVPVETVVVVLFR